LLFAGCDKEEKEPDTVRLVSRIDYYLDSDGNATETVDRTYEFRYDGQNRITEMAETDKNGNRLSNIISYPAENIMVAADSVTYTLNSDGSITALSINGQLLQTCTYTNGYLQKREYYSKLDIAGITIPITSSETCTWENGNISTVANELLFDTDPPDLISVTTTYEYSVMPNKPCSWDFGRLTGIPRGWYGKSVLNLPSKASTQNEDGSEDVTAYRYETDADGYPVKIFVQKNNDREALGAVIEYHERE
jgi:hypothetical protein